ncbi:cytochrome c biogenesis protein ResB [Pseudonocardia acaciae]|uniref:cytochrome c biogenesis protein ResB n=1 Tax=Pseudonocardia acaciae TaxID=551276 RepID=UPI000A073CCC|nr:cytochrome c biogenesis protein ResB [Pseudonocardia acaciae]
MTSSTPRTRDATEAEPVVEEPVTPGNGSGWRPGPVRGLVSAARNTWRGLTSMRTALILLFLLALAALPGALLPQRSLNAAKITEYVQQHPTVGPVLDKLGFFDVFASPWFAAIYLLLFVSLVGCLGPRALEYARACRAQPVATPRNLFRLPHHAEGHLDDPPDEVLRRVQQRLRGWRTVVRERPGADGEPGYTVSAERGYLREAGNLVFHLALVGLLVAFAVGKLFGYEGQVIVLTGGHQFCNSGILGYDSFRAGALVDGTSLSPFCVKVNDFKADYLPNGQPVQYRSNIGYQAGDDLAAGDTGPWRPYLLEVNSPLRIAGDRVYLLGNGYAPTFTVTYPDGTARTQTIQWRTADQATMLAEGATKFDRPGLSDEAARRANQIAVTGLLAPTSTGGKVITSQYPELLRPEVAVDVLRGDLGLDDGRGQSIFEVPKQRLDSGAVKRVARQNLLPGQQLRLDDGTTVRFDSVTTWVSLQVSHDPAQDWVLVFAVLILAGLGTSLTIKRRRFWARIRPARPGEGDDGRRRTVVEIGGLARTDQAGYGEEFARLRADLLPAREDVPRDSRNDGGTA